jgi:hypothetical protein
LQLSIKELMLSAKWRSLLGLSFTILLSSLF